MQSVRANVFDSPSENSFADATRSRAFPCRTRRGTDCPRNLTRAARANAPREFAPASIFRRATDLRWRCVSERADHAAFLERDWLRRIRAPSLARAAGLLRRCAAWRRV